MIGKWVGTLCARAAGRGEDAPSAKKGARLAGFSLDGLLPLGGRDEALCFVLDACAGADVPLSADPPRREERAAP